MPKYARIYWKSAENCAKVSQRQGVAVPTAKMRDFNVFQNLELFIRELGTQVHRALLDHIRSQQFSTEGTTDAVKYVRISSLCLIECNKAHQSSLTPFTFAGGMILSCDMNEYVKMSLAFKVFSRAHNVCFNGESFAAFSGRVCCRVV